MGESDTEFVFYVYDDDPDDPRFGFWLETADGEGMSLYERQPDGDGMWLKPSQGSDYGAVKPSADLKRTIAELLGDGVSITTVRKLPPHERYFVQVIHGTIEEKPDAIPDPVWYWMNETAAEVAHAE
ncbi:MAG: hypothetical protein ACOC9N_01100 [Gemmatimonadota bacterium]